MGKAIGKALREWRYRADGWWGARTLNDVFRANVSRWPRRLALVDPPDREAVAFGAPRRFTYAQLNAEVDRLAGALLQAGIGRNSVLLVQLPNISELLSLYFACARLGAVISPIPVQYRRHELAQIFAILAPDGYVCSTRVKGGDQLAIIPENLPHSCRLFSFGPNPSARSVDLSNAQAPEYLLRRYRRASATKADDIFTICWTSGTTGVPKGVPRSHNHWIAIGPTTYETAGLCDGDVLLNPFPMINMASIGGMMMAWLHTAGTMILHHPFDATVFLQQIAVERPNFAIAPPAILHMLAHDDALVAQVDLSSMRQIGSGSAPLSPAMIRRFQERYGIGVLNLFGSNEGMSLATGPHAAPDPEVRATCFPRAPRFKSPYRNKLLAHMETRIVDLETRLPITREGQAGELLIRGPTVFDGYYKSPELTKQAFTAEGFFKTGDLFEITPGGEFYRFIGRCKDLIIRGGFNIAPEEIDQLLARHPKLIEACAFGVADPVLGERVAVAVVPKAGQVVVLADITAFLHQAGLARFKWPERLLVLQSLPRNALNKVMRRELSTTFAVQQTNAS